MKCVEIKKGSTNRLTVTFTYMLTPTINGTDILKLFDPAVNEPKIINKRKRIIYKKMSQQIEKSKAIKNLQTLRNIGPKIAEKLYRLGIKTPEQMRKSDPEKLFERLQTIDANVDHCELYAFRGAILDIPWWECKNFSKGQIKKLKKRR